MKASLKGWVFFDVITELIERGSTDHAQLTSSQHGLEHVPSVHRTFTGCTRTDNGVHLIYEGDDLPFALFDFFKHGFQTLFELTAIFRTGHH